MQFTYFFKDVGRFDEIIRISVLLDLSKLRFNEILSISRLTILTRIESLID